MFRYRPTSEAAARFIQTHLDVDLEALAAAGPDASPLRPVLPKGVPSAAEDALSSGGASAIQIPTNRVDEGFMILQVQSVSDISLPREQRLRALLEALDPGGSGVEQVGYASAANPPSGGAPDRTREDNDEENEDENKENTSALVDATLKMSEAVEDAKRGGRGRGGNGRCRLLQLILTDGFTRVLAMEGKGKQNRGGDGLLSSASSPPLFPEGVALGAKIKIFLDGGKEQPLHTHGVLRLHPRRAIYLGGRVIALELFWATYAREQLHALTGRPSLSPSLASFSAPAFSSPAGAGSNPPQPPLSLIPPVLSSSPRGISSSPPPCQPLARWSSRGDPHAPFPTRAVITAVASDLLINEYASTAKNDEEEAEGRAGNERETPKTRCAFSLLVSLAPPPAREQRRDAANEENNEESEGRPGAEEESLTVDLGHDWLQELVGMSAEDFRQLSLSREASDMTRMNNIIEDVGARLEQLGEAVFVLRQGLSEQIPTVVMVQPLKESTSAP